MSDMEKSSEDMEDTVVEGAATEEKVAEDIIEETPEQDASAERVDSVEDPIEESETLDTAEQMLEEALRVTESSDEEDECTAIVRSVERQKGVISYLRDLVFGLTFVLLAFMLVFRVVVVSGPSMMDTLQDGDRLILLNNMFYKNPKYGDIIVASKDSFKDGEPIIKRVIATEGQTVDIDFESGIVFVDGEPLDEPYTKTPTNYEEGMQFPLTVSEGCVFVMGDNRNDSLDSRSTRIGLVDCREILGRVLLLAMPGRDPITLKRDFSRIGVLK